MQLSKIPKHILKDIEEYMIENTKFRVDTVEQARAKMEEYSAKELFTMYLEWNGIVNWAETIIMALDSIRAAKETP